jgi:hypothetical protein
MKNILTNQFSVKVKKSTKEAASIYSSQAPRGTAGQRGWVKYRDSEIFKAVPRVFCFCGRKIAPLPLPVLFPRAATPSGTN